MPDYEQELIYTAWPYWECEAEIAKRFYAKASDEDHIFFISALNCGRNSTQSMASSMAYTRS